MTAAARRLIAVIDDDPVEREIIERLAQTAQSNCVVGWAEDVPAFVKDPALVHADLVFLDRVLDRTRDFETSLAELARGGYRGRVILMSNAARVERPRSFGLRVCGPFDKLELQNVKLFSRLMEGAADEELETLRLAAGVMPL